MTARGQLSYSPCRCVSATSIFSFMESAQRALSHSLLERFNDLSTHSASNLVYHGAPTICHAAGWMHQPGETERAANRSPLTGAPGSGHAPPMPCPGAME